MASRKLINALANRLAHPENIARLEKFVDAQLDEAMSKGDKAATRELNTLLGLIEDSKTDAHDDTPAATPGVDAGIPRATAANDNDRIAPKEVKAEPRAARTTNTTAK